MTQNPEAIKYAAYGPLNDPDVKAANGRSVTSYDRSDITASDKIKEEHPEYEEEKANADKEKADAAERFK